MEERIEDAGDLDLNLKRVSQIFISLLKSVRTHEEVGEWVVVGGVLVLWVDVRGFEGVAVVDVRLAALFPLIGREELAFDEEDDVGFEVVVEDEMMRPDAVGTIGCFNADEL